VTILNVRNCHIPTDASAPRLLPSVTIKPGPRHFLPRRITSTNIVATRILLIEDDPSGLLALSEALRVKVSGVVVDTAACAEAALPYLAADQYDCVVCDVLMPGLDGIRLLAIIREQYPDLSVVMITAGEFKREDEARVKGAFAFLPKPLDVDLLIRTVSQAVEKTKSLRAIRE
jgi:DNA-binding NtrC family response regulator